MSEENTALELWKPRDLSGLGVKTDLLPFGPAMAEASALARSRNPSEEVVSGANVESSDIVIPTLLLLQKMSKSIEREIPGAKPGMFMLSTTEEVFEPPIRALVVFFSKSRALFPKVGSPLKTCLSRDMIEGTTYGFCESCQHKNWNDSGDPPACSESMNFVLFMPQGPAQIRFSRQARKAARNFLSSVRMAQQNFWAAPVVIGTEKRSKALPGGQEGVYWLPTIKWDVLDPVPQQLRGQCRVVHDGLQGAFEQGTLKTHGEDQDVDAGDDDRT